MIKNVRKFFFSSKVLKKGISTLILSVVPVYTEIKNNELNNSFLLFEYIVLKVLFFILERMT